MSTASDALPKAQMFVLDCQHFLLTRATPNESFSTTTSGTQHSERTPGLHWALPCLFYRAKPDCEIAQATVRSPATPITRLARETEERRSRSTCYRRHREYRETCYGWIGRSDSSSIICCGYRYRYVARQLAIYADFYCHSTCPGFYRTWLHYKYQSGFEKSRQSGWASSQCCSRGHWSHYSSQSFHA